MFVLKGELSDLRRLTSPEHKQEDWSHVAYWHLGGRHYKKKSKQNIVQGEPNNLKGWVIQKYYME